MVILSTGPEQAIARSGLTTGYTKCMGRMLDIRERTRLRRFLYAKPTIIALALVVALLSRGAWGVYQKSKEASEKHAKAEMELELLLKREGELKADITRLSSDEGVEAEIRERFMVAKEGEKVMIITDPKQEKVHTVTVDAEAPTMMEKMMGAVGFGGE